MRYPSLGPVSIDSLRPSKTCSIGWSVTCCRPDRESQSIEDNGLIDRIAESPSRRRVVAIRSEGLMSSVRSACKAVEATSGAELQVLTISARFSDESMFAIASEKCTIPQPRATENPQIPIIAIAVHKRISVRIAATQIFRKLFDKSRSFLPI